MASSWRLTGFKRHSGFCSPEKHSWFQVQTLKINREEVSFFSLEALRIFTLSFPDSMNVLRKDPACLFLLSYDDECGSYTPPSLGGGDRVLPLPLLFSQDSPQ